MLNNKTEAQEVHDIEDYIKLVGVSAAQFQRMASVSSSTWARIKTGETIPNGATMNRIRDALARLKREKDAEGSGKK